MRFPTFRCRLRHPHAGRCASLPAAWAPRCLALLALTCGVTGRGETAEAEFARAASGDASFAEMVPADAGLFVELVRAPDLLIPLSDSEIWVALAEVAGQPARAAEAEAWRRQIRETVHMSAVEAIQTLLARRAALVGSGLGRSQDAVILCRPADNVRADDLVRSWAGRPLAADVGPGAYLLAGSLGVAVADGGLAFGDAGPSGTMFRRVGALLSGASRESLAGNPVYRSLLARVPPDPDGIFFARLRSGTPEAPATSRPTTQPRSRPARPVSSRPATRGAAATRPQRRAGAGRTSAPVAPLFGGSSNIMLALHREPARGLLHFTAVGDGRTRIPAQDASVATLVQTLPADTLAVWAGHVNYDALLEQAAVLPKKNLARVVLSMQRQVPRADRLVPTLGSATAIALGSVTPAGGDATLPPVPALAALVAAGDPPEAAHAFRALIDTSVAVCNLMALSPGVDMPRLPDVTEFDADHHPSYVLDLDVVLEKYGLKPTLRELHLCWTVDANVLIVASHKEWLTRILASRHDAAATLAPLMRLTQREVSPQADTVAVLRVGPMADMARAWLHAFERVAPQILDDAWWRDRQPGGGSVRLGISGDQDAQRRRLVIRSVDPGGPAGAVLQPGDEIVACNGRPLTTSQPADEIRSAIAQRESGWIDLTLERQGAVFTRRVALPFVNPVDLLRKLAALGRVVGSAIYHTDVPDVGPRGFLTVQLRAAPLVAPESGPASNPVAP